MVHGSETRMYGGVEGLKHTSIDDSGGSRQDGGATRAVRDGLVNTPVGARGICGGDWAAWSYSFRNG